MTLIIAYGDLGNEVDAGWFNSSLVPDEKFITFIVGNTTGLGYSVDKEGGLFRDTPDGISRPVTVEGGRLVVDTVEMANRRRERRGWKSLSGIEGSQET